MLTIEKQNKQKTPFSYLVLSEVSQLKKNEWLTEQELDYVKIRHCEDQVNFFLFHKFTHEVAVQLYKEQECPWKTLEDIRKSGAAVYKKLRNVGIKQLVIYSQETEDKQRAFAEGLLLGSYEFDKYFSHSEHRLPFLTSICFDNKKVFQEAGKIPMDIKLAAITKCRDLVNEPPCVLNAEKLARAFVEMGNEVEGLKVTVWDKKQIQKQKMGGLLAVNRGSVDEPTFTIMEWKPENAVNRRPLVLVGKGLVYDSGGLNLKPGDYMNNMKEDMAGAATMASVVYAIAKSDLPIHVIALLPATDNKPSATAFASSDIITMYDGTNVEVVNTDAEGRMILADALAYAKKYNPELVFDAATLTGAASRAIGPLGLAAVHQKAEQDMQLLKTCGNEVYERVAEFPFWDEYGDSIKSKVADIKNSGEGFAGMQTAGKFLAHFTDYPYIHLDIAGVAFTEKPKDYFSYGGTGFGIRLLLSFIEKKYL